MAIACYRSFRPKLYVLIHSAFFICIYVQSVPLHIECDTTKSNTTFLPITGAIFAVAPDYHSSSRKRAFVFRSLCDALRSPKALLVDVSSRHVLFHGIPMSNMMPMTPVKRHAHLGRPWGHWERIFICHWLTSPFQWQFPFLRMAYL